MAFEAERRFVNGFVRPDRRERLLFELTNPKKRCRGLDRFCHQSAELIDEKKIMLQGRDLERQPAFADFAARHAGDCLILSPDGMLDGCVAPFSEVAALAFAGLDAAIALGDGFALVVGEAEKGGRAAYLLINDKMKG